MKANGQDQIDMAMEFNTGLTELNIMDFGRKIKLAGKASLLMQMVIYMKVNGKMTKLLALEFTYMQSLMQNMKDIGKMI